MRDLALRRSRPHGIVCPDIHQKTLWQFLLQQPEHSQNCSQPSRVIMGRGMRVHLRIGALWMVQRGRLWKSPLTITVVTLWFEMKGHDTLNAEIMYFLRWIAIGKVTSDLGI
jgi:hypothetical protein